MTMIDINICNYNIQNSHNTNNFGSIRSTRSYTKREAESLMGHRFIGDAVKRYNNDYHHHRHHQQKKQIFLFLLKFSA